SFAKLKQEDIDLVLVSRALHANSTPEAQEILGTIDKWNVHNRVKVLSNVPLKPKSVLASLYAGAYWYVQPSLYEGFGLPVLEAMQCGTPVISSLGGSLKELVDESNAIVFQPESEEQMVKALDVAIGLTDKQRDKLKVTGV